jgi:hypothetical protein
MAQITYQGELREVKRLITMYESRGFWGNRVSDAGERQ